MKTALFALSALLLISSAPAARAATISVAWVPQHTTIVSNWLDEAYSCDDAEYVVKDVLTKFGARDIQLDCDGGLPEEWSLTVTASFSSAKASGATEAEQASFQAVSISGFDDGECGLHESVVEDLLPFFSTTGFDGVGPCATPNDEYEFDGTVLK